jgi:hypothetical protein
LEFAVFAHEPFQFQRIADEVLRMRRLGMSLRAIGAALRVDEKTVRKVLGRGLLLDAPSDGERPSYLLHRTDRSGIPPA